MLTQNDSHYLLETCKEQVNISIGFEIVKGTGAKFGRDGDHFYYGFGHLAEPDGVYGFGKTPMDALNKFTSAFYSQTIKPVDYEKKN